MKSHSSRSVFCVAFTVTFALVFATDVTAKDKYLPLPPQIMTAKTVYIDNETGVSKVGDQCYQEIQKWGPLQVVQGRKQADLILLLSYQQYVTTTTSEWMKTGRG